MLKISRRGGGFLEESEVKMELNQYQEKAAESDFFEKTGDLMAPGFMEKVLGLSGEAGEVSDKVKKIIRDKNGEISAEEKEGIVKELGDVMWYLAGIARYLDVSLEEVAEKNIEKLQSRKKRGVLSGSGDDR